MSEEENSDENSENLDDIYLFSQKDIGAYSFPIFEELRKEQKLCDVVLKVDTKKLPAHKIILSATIPYFYAMFTHDMIETKQDEIEIQEGIDAEAFESLIKYAYTGNVLITPNNVQSLLLGASFLQLHQVRSACCDYLKSRLHVNNVLGVKAFADTLGCVSLGKAAQTFIQKQFSQVSISEEFFNLSFNELVETVFCDELNVKNELNVFEAIMAWVKKDVEVRKKFLPDLLAQVRLPLLSPQELVDYIASEELIKNSHRCRDLIDEAKDYHLMPERRHLMQSFRTSLRIKPDVVGVIYAIGGLTKNGYSVSTVELYDPQIGKWKTAKAMTMLRSRVGVAVMDNKLYAIGGYNGTERLSAVEVFFPKTQQWMKVSSLKWKRSAVGAATLNNQLYVCGGYDGVTSLKTVERYIPDKDKWVMVTSMTKQRSAAGVVALDEYLYALGGHDGLFIFDSGERYDYKSEQWTSITPMLTKRCRLGVATLKGKIYVAGGYDGSKFLHTAEVYDPQTKQWSPIAPMNVMRSRVALVANGSKLYAIGGYDGISNLRSVEVYDPELDQWRFVASMCSHEGGVGAGVIPKS